MRQNPRPNEIYRHFKGKMYQILTLARHSETMEVQVVYQQLYAPYGVFVRPLDMFMSEVDHVKYPEVTQKYRFEKVQEPTWEDLHFCNSSESRTEEKTEAVVAPREDVLIRQEESSQEEITLDAGLLEFLEADSYEEKLEILNRIHNTLDDAMIDTMAVSLDMEIKEGDIEQRYTELMSCLLKMEHFECNRLR